MADTCIKDVSNPAGGRRWHCSTHLIGAAMFIALLVLFMFVVVPLLSLRYGVDSRHFTTRERRSNW